MQILLLIGGILLFLIGFGLLFGISWAFLVADLLSMISGGHVTGGFTNNSADTYKGAQKLKLKITGVCITIIGILSFLYSLTL